MEKLSNVTFGQRVYWEDCDQGLSNGVYDVVLIDGCENDEELDELKEDLGGGWNIEDAIIGLDNGFSYVEAYLCELSEPNEDENN